MDVVDAQDKQAQWHSITIAKDVGASENTIMDLDSLLMTINADLPLALQFSSDQTCEKILREIAVASRTFQVTATTELNALAGVPGQPLVRQFQLAPAAPGTGSPCPASNHTAPKASFWLFADTAASADVCARPSTCAAPAAFVAFASG
jgi:hypothetical protein